MAETLLKESRLKLIFDNGVDGDGKQLFKSKTFSNIRLDSTPDELQSAAQAIASLSQKALYGVERNDSSDIQA
ncbi:hypothetical protein AN964_02330 [Heyndrickxia shackletonii]|uniref:DUF1659 domain-containing protein n=1 Tax=Heyndrickxia shackletonii TaxID=157838 RepID=A0A0Q3TFT2_9BACI|nr:DUF1659 domain-containing protein [Heyndrickxia shackletonii]KQL52489.1 hypothetical protein AN964_02330 [Heyndrickxia shackletonii]MBB2479275.1 DUF1659 domain-containing protein [Bacillus sp. APMAM]NEY98940.1 DUF1659 domain-containing protein [Heyndrickxia shackletonii]RTZ57170.1 DUF1659 domain-containing protein [Bacillus sp. SAJ1]